MHYGPFARNTLRQWLDATGNTDASVAAAIGVNPSLVRQWLSGEGHLPAAILPALGVMGRPEVWTEALAKQIANLQGDEPVTEDHLPIARRLLRTMAEASDLASKGAALLEDGAIDRNDARKLLPEALEVAREVDRLIALCRALIDGSSGGPS